MSLPGDSRRGRESCVPSQPHPSPASWASLRWELQWGERWALWLPQAGARVTHALFPQFCLWTDGLNVLLGKEMTSERMQTDLDVLLSMELKLRLLDLENISIPDTPPPVPKPPSNLNFCYDFSHAEQ